MTDPFHAIKQPMTDEQAFFGRRAEVAWLIDQLDRGEQLLVVYGSHRKGKSSLLRQLVRRLPDAYLAVYLDVGRAGYLDSESSAHTAHGALQMARQVGQSVREQTDIHVEPPEAIAFADDPLQAWQTYLSALADQLGRRQLVLLVDDADRIEAREHTRILLQARTSTILAMESQDRLTRLLPDPEMAPPAITLGPLDNEAAEALIKALVTVKAQIDPWAVRRILDITSNHPYYVRLFCQVLLECCAYRSPLTPPDVEEALRSLLDMPMVEFGTIWENLPPREQFILSGFSALRGTGGIATQYDIQKFCIQRGYPLPLSDIVTALNNMVRRGILEKLGANSYRFTLELFRLWLHRHRPPDQVWRSGRSWFAFHLIKLGHALSRRPGLWMSLGAIAFVAMLVVLQPALRRGGVSPTATFARTTAAVTELTQLVVPTVVATNTSVPTPAVVLPGYDLTFMSRVDQDALWQIYVMNSRTGKRLRLTETDSNERTPQWSPDGRKLVFASDRDGNREVYVMDIEGVLQGVDEAYLINLTQNKAPDWQPTWSPDGTRVAFSSHRDENWEIYVINADGTRLTRLTEHPESDLSPAWSPDGQKLVLVSRRYGDADLFVMDVETGECTQLTKGELDEYDPAWSPNGEWIAFVTQMGDQSDVFVMRADGSDPVNLTHSPYANDFQPIWMPDSEGLVFVSYTFADGDYELYRMRRDGTEVIRLTDDDNDNLAPSWRSNVR